MNLNDFFSKPTRIKEAYANNYPSYTPPAAAADVSSDDTDGLDSTDSAGEPKFDRLGKTGREASIDFRNGFTPGDDETDYETKNEPELGTFRMGKPVEPDDAATNAFIAAFQGAGEQNADNSGPLEPGEFRTNDGRIWRFVSDPAAAPAKKEVQWIPSSAADSIASWKANNPGKSAADWRSIAAAGKPASASGLPKMRFDIASQRLVPVDQPIALDMSPKTKDIKSGSNPNIDADTRARARAWAAAKNPGVDTVGNIQKRVAAKPTATSADGTAALLTPAAAPAVVKPVVVKPVTVSPVANPAEVPAVTLRDIPVEKPSSWKDIARANNISNPDRIMPGQVLKIPGKADYTVQPGDTLADIAAGKIKAPKYTPTPGNMQAVAADMLKKNPKLGATGLPFPKDVQDNLGTGMGPIKQKTYDPFGNEIIKKVGREEFLTPEIIKREKEADLIRTPADVDRVLAANLKANNERIAARDATASRKKVKEDDIDEQTVPNEFKWGAPSWTARDGTVLAYDKKTNAYNMSSGPTKPDPNTMWSGIQTQRTTMKNGQPVNVYDRTTIAVNPATGTGHYNRSSQEGDNEPTIIHRRDVPADELAKLRADAGIPPKANDIDEGTFDDQTQVSSIERDSTSDIDGKTDQSFSSTSFQQDPADPGNNSYMDRQDNNGVASTTFARNVTPKWMSNLKATAGLPGAKPAAQPPSQYPTQVGQGMNNKPFAAYSTPPGQLEINRESLDRMRSLAGIRKK